MMTAAGDVERDFWLAYDLLQNPKDHAEFTIVRNWVQKALEVTIPECSESSDAPHLLSWKLSGLKHHMCTTSAACCTQPG